MISTGIRKCTQVINYHVIPLWLLFRFLMYGALGTVIGHELTHGFDDQGNNGWSHYVTY